MPDTETLTGTTVDHALTAREKRDMQRAQLRPLANLRPELYDEDDYSSDELEAMMAMYNGTMASIEEGEIVSAKVLDIRDNMVILDIGFKSEGTIPFEEFKDMPELKAGDQVEVLLEQERAGKRERLMKELQKDQIRKGVLNNITAFGAFIDLGGVDGLLHITDMSYG